jgi:bifunctional ADP-heptose synthase (sugar kinase/adenylyltransferase)
LFLDTRTKIIARNDVASRLQDPPATWISGHFDPLLAEHVARLARMRQPGRPLVVEITNPAQPLLAQRARAELVAALAMVDFVVLGEGDALMDADIGQRFVAHVLQRHAQESSR